MIESAVAAVVGSLITAIISAAANVYVTQRVLSVQLASLNQQLGKVEANADKAHVRIDTMMLDSRT